MRLGFERLIHDGVGMVNVQVDSRFFLLKELVPHTESQRSAHTFHKPAAFRNFPFSRDSIRVIYIQERKKKKKLGSIPLQSRVQSKLPVAINLPG